MMSRSPSLTVVASEIRNPSGASEAREETPNGHFVLDDRNQVVAGCHGRDSSAATRSTIGGEVVMRDR